MQNSSIRYVQHHLADVLKIVETGEEVQILRRNRPVAKIVPLDQSKNPGQISWEGHFSEINKIFKGKKVKGKPMPEVISNARGEY